MPYRPTIRNTLVKELKLKFDKLKIHTSMRVEENAADNGKDHWDEFVSGKGQNVQIIQIGFCLE